MKNKRGVSGVVIEVLLILITIAAVVLIASFVVPFVKDKLQQSTQCLDFKESLVFQESVSYKGEEFNFNCQKDNFYSFSVKNNGGTRNKTFNMESFAVTFSDGQNVRKVIISDGVSSDGVRLLNSSSLELKVPKVGDVQTYTYSSSMNFKTIEVYPMLGDEVTCEMSDSVSIIKCADNVIPYL